jgi:hypothetical protein
MCLLEDKHNHIDTVDSLCIPLFDVTHSRTSFLIFLYNLSLFIIKYVPTIFWAVNYLLTASDSFQRFYSIVHVDFVLWVLLDHPMLIHTAP